MSNGPTEAVNLLIEKIRRLGHGYRKARWPTRCATSYGMELALRGVPLPFIQQLLGHADPRTCSIYTTAHATDLTDTLRDAGRRTASPSSPSR